MDLIRPGRNLHPVDDEALACLSPTIANMVPFERPDHRPGFHPFQPVLSVMPTVMVRPDPAVRCNADAQGFELFPGDIPGNEQLLFLSRKSEQIEGK